MQELMMTKDELAQAIAEAIEQKSWALIEASTEDMKVIVLEVLNEAFA